MFLVLAFRPVNPAKKTNAQPSPKNASPTLKHRTLSEEEIKKERQNSDDSMPPANTTADTRLVQLAANIRATAREAYEKAFTLKLAEGRPEQVFYWMGISNVLISRLYEASPDFPPLSSEATEVILMECAPFKNLTPQEGMPAMIEYVVWREYPSLADEVLISNAMRNMTHTYSAQLVEDFKGWPFPRVVSVGQIATTLNRCGLARQKGFFDSTMGMINVQFKWTKRVRDNLVIPVST